MSKQFQFFDKEDYENVIKYQGEPPCSKCVVRAMCFNAAYNDGDYEITLSQPCDEASDWFFDGENLGDFIRHNMTKLDGSLLGPKDIKKLIQQWDYGSVDGDELAEKIGLSSIWDLGDFINSLNPLYCNSPENELRRKLMGPIVKEACKLLDEKKT
jgi:hypothetical protein